MSNQPANNASAGRKFKRIIVCCDGTWMDSLGDKGGEPPSNVTRISRLFKRTCFDDRVIQITFYQPGVGSDGSSFQRYTAGFLGTGLEAHICEAYNFICANYVDGDEIILTGFSRGAFTARSIADMIASVGLLTPEGLDYFHAIFNDYEAMGDDKRNPADFMCPNLEKYDKQTGAEKAQWEERRKDQFREWLKQDPRHYTRDTEKSGKQITIKALGVWDTVGTLGIPPAPAIGIVGSAKQWKFTNTQVSSKVENAFQALALDEPRAPFLPALWERTEDNSTNLKQVWFPGNHGGVGGGWYDQQISNITLAWMCDQLSSVGVEFSFDRMTSTFENGKAYSAAHPFPYVPASGVKSWFVNSPKPPSWAVPDIYNNLASSIKQDLKDCTGHDNHPTDPQDSRWSNARPWGLGQTREAGSWVQNLSGQVVRKPGLSMRTDADTNAATNEPLLRTNERIHSSVRIRLAAGGLSLDDKERWKCLSLRGEGTKEKDPPLWRLEHESGLDKSEAARVTGFKANELSLSGQEYPESVLYKPASQDGNWRWVYNKKPTSNSVPQARILPEEPLIGYWERYLLSLIVHGKEDVWRWAETNPPRNFLSI